jgi:isopenicillin N synthase-like dioxygenase
MDRVNGKGQAGRGIGSHTDYGLLVIAGQDDVGGLFVRPPISGEEVKNWEKSAAGLNEGDDKWHYIPPVDGVLTVFPGSSSLILSTPLNIHIFLNIGNHSSLLI